MSYWSFRRGVGAVFLGLLLPTMGWTNPPALNVIDKQSQNEGLWVLPAKKPVVVDGNLAEWDLRGRIEIFPDFETRDRYSVQVQASWDANALFLAFRWKDPDGQHNEVDPAVEPGSGWRADAVQLRIATPDQTTWLTTWLFSPKQIPVVLKEVWKDPKNSRAGQVSQLFQGKPGETQLGEGIEMAYRNEEGGFIQELRIPWNHLYANPPTAASGNRFAMGIEVIWGGPDGRTKFVNRYADNVQPGVTKRQFFWNDFKIWGDAMLVSEAPAEARSYQMAVADAEAMKGVPVRFPSLPSEAAAMTVVIENESGQRVRNLVADFPIQSAQAVAWDGLDDDGLAVKPGTYVARGLTRPALKVVYEGSYFNPGDPPWALPDGTGAWGADHTNPAAVAADGNNIFLGWPYAEGGFGTIGLNEAGKKIWSQRTGAAQLTIVGNEVWGVFADMHGEKDWQLSRFDRITGKGKPFEPGGKMQPFPFSLTQLLGAEFSGKIIGLVAANNQVFLGTSEGKLYSLTFEAEKLADINIPGLTQLAGSPELGLLAVAEGKLLRLANGKTEPVTLPSGVEPGCLSIRPDGLIALWNFQSSQVVLGRIKKQAFETIGTIGQAGGRPIRGSFEPLGLKQVTSLAFGPKGELWVVESDLFPRRISVWSEPGKLIREYVGNTGYSGSGSYLHPQNPDAAFLGPIEMRRNETGDWKVNRVLWVPDRSKGECFEWNYRDYGIPQLFRPAKDPKKREWIFYPNRRTFLPRVFFVEAGESFRPAAAIVLAGHVSGGLNARGAVEKQPEDEFAGLNGYDLLFWTDANADGKVQRAECEVAPALKPAEVGGTGQPAFPLAVGWGGRADNGFAFFTTDGRKVFEFKPVEITEQGYPRFSPTSVIPHEWSVNGEIVPLPDQQSALMLDTKRDPKRSPRIAAIRREDGRVLWSYPNPFPGVHGSHEATMDRPGLVIGSLFLSGVVEAKNPGGFFTIRGNSGQDFLFTLDGLMVGSLFRDARHPGANSLPATEAELRQKNLMDYTLGFEPFMGWFGKQSDGVVRLTLPTAGQAVMIARLEGLDGIKRLEPIQIKLTEADVVSRSSSDHEEPDLKKTATVRRVPEDFKFTDASEWKTSDSLRIENSGAAESAKVRLAYNEKFLFLEYTVTDASPWKNHGADFRKLFKSGDAVDFQFGPFGSRKDPGAADSRILIAPLDGKPAAVWMKPVIVEPSKKEPYVYESPVGRREFQLVRLAPEVGVSVETRSNGYVVQAAIPLGLLGVKSPAEGSWWADFGIILSDDAGQTNVARRYWNHSRTNLVSDLPSEAWFSPGTGGELKFAK